jgi:hypothetical protein
VRGAFITAGDRDENGRARLSYERAEALFREHSGGATLHQLRYSALTHDAEDGASAPLLMAESGTRRSALSAGTPGQGLRLWQGGSGRPTVPAGDGTNPRT